MSSINMSYDVDEEMVVFEYSSSNDEYDDDDDMITDCPQSVTPSTPDKGSSTTQPSSPPTTQEPGPEPPSDPPICFQAVTSDTNEKKNPSKKRKSTPEPGMIISSSSSSFSDDDEVVRFNKFRSRVKVIAKHPRDREPFNTREDERYDLCNKIYADLETTTEDKSVPFYYNESRSGIRPQQKNRLNRRDYYRTYEEGSDRGRSRYRERRTIDRTTVSRNRIHRHDSMKYNNLRWSRPGIKRHSRDNMGIRDAKFRNPPNSIEHFTRQRRLDCHRSHRDNVFKTSRNIELCHYEDVVVIDVDDTVSVGNDYKNDKFKTEDKVEDRYSSSTDHRKSFGEKVFEMLRETKSLLCGLDSALESETPKAELWTVTLSSPRAVAADAISVTWDQLVLNGSKLRSFFANNKRATVLSSGAREAALRNESLMESLASADETISWLKLHAVSGDPILSNDPIAATSGALLDNLRVKLNPVFSCRGCGQQRCMDEMLRRASINDATDPISLTLILFTRVSKYMRSIRCRYGVKGYESIPLMDLFPTEILIRYRVGDFTLAAVNYLTKHARQCKFPSCMIYVSSILCAPNKPKGKFFTCEPDQ